MAILNHPSFPAPSDPNAVIWRYMDLPKLLSLLMSQSLHLTKLADLTDHSEGRFPHHLVRKVNEDFVRTERMCDRDPGTNPRYAEAMIEWVRNCIYVNCWCMQPHESEALWRIYGGAFGVAITTTFSRLADAVPADCYLGQVRYLDYELEGPSPDNFFNLAMHKRTFFRHEHEVRVARSVLPTEWTHPPSWSGQTPPHCTVPIPWTALTDIRPSPYSPNWFVDVLREAVRRFNCPLPLVRSKMLDE